MYLGLKIKIRQILSKIEGKRNSSAYIFMFLVKFKDILWSVFDLLKKLNFIFQYSLNRGKIPDFIIAGFKKSGTTSLYENLKLHSNVEMSPFFFDHFDDGPINTKEITFFNDEKRFARGVNWYKKQFKNNLKIQGEATPDYLDTEESIKNMHSVLPNAKIILILRDPVKRAYSQYCNCIQFEKIKQTLFLPNDSFEKNIYEEITGGLMKTDGLIKRGLYAKQIETLFKYYKREQVLIIISEQMKKDMRSTYKEIFKFLDIPNQEINFINNVNTRKYKQDLDEKTEKYLYDFFKPYNQELFTLLGYEIPEWNH